MKFQLTALKQQQFKAAICARIPTDQIDAKGNTVFGEAHFVGLFKTQPISFAREQFEQLEVLRESGDTKGALALAAKQLDDAFIGFEKHPSHDFPFLDGDEPIACTPDSIKALLDIKEVREAIQDAFNTARSGDVLTKNSKK